jgi:hypothetical protein
MIAGVHEPYVADPAEPPRTPRFARLRPAVATLAVILLVAAGMTLYWVGRGEEDPALQAPAAENGGGAATEGG